MVRFGVPWNFVLDARSSAPGSCGTCGYPGSGDVETRCKNAQILIMKKKYVLEQRSQQSEELQRACCGEADVK